MISSDDKYLLRQEIENGLISDKSALKQKIKEKPQKYDEIVDDYKENSYKKPKFESSRQYNKSKKYGQPKEFKDIIKNQKPKPINPDKNYRDGLNRQNSIYGVRMADLVARCKDEEKIYDKLNDSLAHDMHNKTWYLLKDALKIYRDNPIFLYYKALALYRNRNFDYADDCISKAKYYAMRYELSDNFIDKCNELQNDEETRRVVSTKKRPKRPSRRVYKNNRSY